MADKRIVLVTGATRGIGKETVKQLGQKGFKVLLAGRDAAQADATAAVLAKEHGIDVSGIQLDVTSNASVQAAVAAVQAAHGKLDVLINNAGVMGDENTYDPTTVDVAALRAVYETNIFGVVECCVRFLPLLRKSDAPRIVNVSTWLSSLAERSDANSPIRGYWRVAYDSSKAALNLYTVELAMALEKENPNFKVNVIHPGWVRTDMGGAGADLPLEEGAETSVLLATIGNDGPTATFTHRGNTVKW